MPYILPKPCIHINFVSYLYFNRRTPRILEWDRDLYEYSSSRCQLFVTTNLMIVLDDDKNIRMYCENSFCEQTSKKNIIKKDISPFNYILMDEINLPCFKKITELAKHKLNYNRIYKDIESRFYINYQNVIVNIIERFFSNT